MILPGAAYTEKAGLYANFEGRVQRAERAGFPPGEAKEDWAILRALSDVLGKRLPYDNVDALRAAMRGRCAAFREVGAVPPAQPGADPAIWNAIGADGALDESRAARQPDHGFLSHQPDRARERDHGRMQPAVRDAAQPRWRRSRHGPDPPPSKASDCPMAGRGSSARPVIMVVLTAWLLMLSVAAVILADRKIWAAVQMRRGPNVVGAFGLLQTIADALKFVFKEVIIPSGANKVLFLLAPLVTAVLAFAAWAVIPFDAGWVISNINVGILYLFAISSLGVYGVIVAGWASNSKYAFLSALRAAAQMVSYEVSIGFVMVTVLLFAGSLNLSDIVEAQRHGWFAFTILFPMFVIFFISAAGGDASARPSTCWKPNPSWWPASWSNIPRRRSCCSSSANT